MDSCVGFIENKISYPFSTSVSAIIGFLTKTKIIKNNFVIVKDKKIIPDYFVIKFIKMATCLVELKLETEESIIEKIISNDSKLSSFYKLTLLFIAYDAIKNSNWCNDLIGNLNDHSLSKQSKAMYSNVIYIKNKLISMKLNKKYIKQILPLVKQVLDESFNIYNPCLTPLIRDIIQMLNDIDNINNNRVSDFNKKIICSKNNFKKNVMKIAPKKRKYNLDKHDKRNKYYKHEKQNK